tara:strand:- start:350 stop:688 length:339 start_codon:yes stop_codon:yes gene_type:complete
MKTNKKGERMYKITFKHENVKTTLVSPNKKFVLGWEEEVFKHFLFTGIGKWKKTTEVVVTSPAPYKPENSIFTHNQSTFLQSIGWYHVNLDLFVNDPDHRAEWQTTLVKQEI